jgi:EAL domain-containing protein (putative c-di-GMP-specific phosphodiesterase class I)
VSTSATTFGLTRQRQGEHLVTTVFSTPRIGQDLRVADDRAINVRFAYQPLYSLHSGGIVAVEALARPAHGTVGEMLTRARHEGRLTATDTELAAAAIHSEAEQQTLLPLHLNLLAGTVAAPRDALDPVLLALT